MSDKRSNKGELSKDILSKNTDKVDVHHCEHYWEETNAAIGYGNLLRKCRKCGKEEYDTDFGNIYY